MFEKLKQIWRILFPPKQPPKPKIPPRPEYDVTDLMRRGEELKELYNQDKQTQHGICPNCRSNAEKLVTCAKCGKKGCDYCMTYDPSEGKYFCEQCW